MTDQTKPDVQVLLVRFTKEPEWKYGSPEFLKRILPLAKERLELPLNAKGWLVFYEDTSDPYAFWVGWEREEKK